MPPLTPRSNLMGCSAGPPVPRFDRAVRPPASLNWAGPLPVVVLQLALSDLFKCDRQVVLRVGLNHRRRELVESALAEVVVVGVDLAGALGGDDHARVVGVDVLEQLVNAGGDHYPTE